MGYEFDGVPVNRSFDNYASSSASSLGNAEVQVYTGANPATSEGQGLSGFVNQVIKSGTFPGYATGSLGIGTPSFYHRAAMEVGGSTPDRMFSYYVGVAGLNQSFSYINNNNGSEYDNWLGPVRASSGGPYGKPFAPGWSLFYGNVGNAYFPLGPVSWREQRCIRSDWRRSTAAIPSLTSTSGFRIITTRAATISSCSMTTKL